MQIPLKNEMEDNLEVGYLKAFDTCSKQILRFQEMTDGSVARLQY